MEGPPTPERRGEGFRYGAPSLNNSILEAEILAVRFFAVCCGKEM